MSVFIWKTKFHFFAFSFIFSWWKSTSSEICSSRCFKSNKVSVYVYDVVSLKNHLNSLASNTLNWWKMFFKCWFWYPITRHFPSFFFFLLSFRSKPFQSGLFEVFELGISPYQRINTAFYHKHRTSLVIYFYGWLCDFTPSWMIKLFVGSEKKEIKEHTHCEVIWVEHLHNVYDVTSRGRE